MQPPVLYDNHNRPITYVRLAVTDRCNLRCFYCMPEHGIQYLPKKELLSYEEMLRLAALLARMGISKVRITGGEPFVRRDLMPFLERLSQTEGIRKITLTTNGVLTAPHVPALAKMGIDSVNLSIDSLDRARFARIARRDELPRVMETLHSLLQHGIRTKLNAVVMDGQNTEDIIPLATFARDHAVDVRFIEEMPFNGEGAHAPVLVWHHRKILTTLQEAFPDIEKIPDEPFSTSMNYRIPGFQGNIGIIAAFSRTFCGMCNRIRITAQGTLKTCLYDDGVLNVRDLLRQYPHDDAPVEAALRRAFSQRPKDGFEAERNRSNHLPVSESMSTIGG
ncbi:GTP 3',8-cyclase MoaA [Rhodoflexus caldus]|uniref:GTP 3',8-cyclase MoaA n=1 Tax=Rhodoflexus caldus TaxID=2891236 RepID=UPI00202A0581|nr:GTP 3',8-cyclase MoaA [Rhodoflexus caldus]